MKQASFAFLLSAFLVLPPASAAQDVWRTGISDKATEAQIIRDYGRPIRVEITMPAFAAIRDGKAAEYRFIYTLVSDNQNLLNGGPLGEAGSVTVYFAADRRVQSIEWKYIDGYRYHKRTNESRTKITKEQIEALAGTSPITTSKLEGGLPADAKVYDFEVNGLAIRVLYLGSENELDVMVTYR